MPNAGRFVVATSTLLALVGAFGFALVTLSAPQVHVDTGGSSCMASTGSGTTAFGLTVRNTGDEPVTLDSIEAETTTNLASIDYSALPARSLGDRAVGVGTDNVTDVVGWTSRRAVADAPIPAHSEVTVLVVPRLAANVDSGNARDFVVRMTGVGGVQHAFVSRSNVGFYPAGRSNTLDCEGH